MKLLPKYFAKLASFWVMNAANIYSTGIAYMKICLMWGSLPIAFWDLALSLAIDIRQ